MHAWYPASERTVAKWLARHRAEGVNGLQDRSSRPARSPAPKLQCPGGRGAEAASPCAYPASKLPVTAALSKATVSRLLRRHGLSRLAALDPAPPVVRDVYAQPGGLLHFDIKKLGSIVRPGHRVTGDRRDHTRGAGYEYVHVAIDDASRIAFAKILPDESKLSALAFLHDTLAYFRSLGDPSAAPHDR